MNNTPTPARTRPCPPLPLPSRAPPPMQPQVPLCIRGRCPRSALCTLAHAHRAMALGRRHVLRRESRGAPPSDAPVSRAASTLSPWQAAERSRV